MMRAALRLIVILSCFFITWADLVAEEIVRPDDVEGLEAWYDINSLYGKKQNGEPVRTWNDSSGNGHHLTDDQNGLPAVFRTSQLNDMPAVLVGEANTHSVAQPFELNDYTIFLVYASGTKKRALFSSESNDRLGVVLRDEGTHDKFQMNASAGSQNYQYNTDLQLQGQFSITVLAREADLLKSFVNGRELSADVMCGAIVRVGKFFQISHSKFSRSAGKGLRIAEMIFYSRYLAAAERSAVSEYLADKYKLTLDPTSLAQQEAPPAIEAPDLAGSQAWLGTTTEADVNATVAIEWDLQEKVDIPFRHSTGAEENTLLHCTSDSTTARVYVSMTFVTSTADTLVRVLILKNEGDYLPEETWGEPVGEGEQAKRATVELQATVTLDAGDFLRIITAADGAAGKVTIEPGSAVFAVELVE